MEQWTEVRRRVLTGKLSKHAACREYDISWHTLEKMLAHEEPPGYRQRQPRHKPKLEPYLPIIHEILEGDRQTPPKQRHTAHAFFNACVQSMVTTAAIVTSAPRYARGSSRPRKCFFNYRIHRVRPRSISGMRMSIWPESASSSPCS